MNPWRLSILSLIRQWPINVVLVGAMTISITITSLLFLIHQMSGFQMGHLGMEKGVLVGPKSGEIDLVLSTLVPATNVERAVVDYVPMNLFNTISEHRSVQFEDGSIQQAKSEQNAVPMLEWGKVGSFKVWGTNNNFFKMKKIIQPLSLTPDGVVVGALAAREMNWRVGDEITLDPTIDVSDVIPDRLTRKFRISAIMAPTESFWDLGIYADLTMAQAAMSEKLKGLVWKNQVLSFFLVETDQPQAVINLINQRSVAQALDVKSVIEKLKILRGQNEELHLLVGALILFLCLVIVCSLLYMRFDHLRGQVATLRAIGWTLKSVLFWFLFESSLISGLSILISFLFFALFQRSFLVHWFPEVNFYFSDSLFSVFGQMPILLGLGVVGCGLSLIGPLVQLLRMDVHELLRG